jgi:hypothetical protein
MFVKLIGVAVVFGALVVVGGCRKPRGDDEASGGSTRATKGKAEKPVKDVQPEADKPVKGKPKGEPKPEDDSPVLELNAEELVEAFTANRKEAEAKYIGKRVRITGVAHKVVPVPSKLPLGKRPDPFIDIGDGSKSNVRLSDAVIYTDRKVQCSFPESMVDTVRSIKEGDAIIIEGTISTTTSYGFGCKATAVVKR